MEDCIIWTGAKTGNGYGVRQINGRMEYVHRLAMMETIGAIPKGMVVAHKCDTPACYNPAHLFVCTQRENLADMKAKGRSATGNKHGSKTHPERTARGERVGGSKLTEHEILAIRAMYVPRKVSLTQVAKKFGIAFQTVSKIVNAKSWKHVKGVKNGN